MMIKFFKSPLGWLKLQVSDSGLELVEFVDELDEEAEEYEATGTTANARQLMSQVVAQLNEYFSGTRKNFKLKLAVNGTQFQKQVWTELSQIPFGQTVSYKDIALGIDNPKAVRAVGGANGKNPIPIIVPCHRVVAANGDLGGYSSGLARKKWLLNHEGIKAW